MAKQKPTPSKTPWVWNTYQRHGIKTMGESESGFYIVSPPGFDIALLPITANMNGEIQGANTRMIIKAVNNHESLVASLRSVTKYLYLLPTEVADQVRQSLASAEEKQ